MRIMRCRNLILSAILAVLIVAAPWAAESEQPLISNVFDNTFLVDALRDISAQGGVAIVADATVAGQVTLTLDNVTLEEALARLLLPGGYVFRKIGGYYLVGSPDPKNPSFALLSLTEVIKLCYIKAGSAFKSLSDNFTQYVKVDADTNLLIITAPQMILDRIKADLALIDRPISQVMFEALVVEVSKNGRKELGLDWEWNRAAVPNLTESGSGTLQMVNLEAGLVYVTPGGLNEFMVSLKATVDKGQARVEANPRLVTLDGQTAEIFIGRERYYSIRSGTDEKSIERMESIKTGITLTLQPQVAENGEITVKIIPDISDVVTDTTSSSGGPVVNRRHVSTTVRVKDGNSIVLGGLIQRVNSEVTRKVPILGSLPLLGLLFSKTETVSDESEVLIILTPRVLKEGASGDAQKEAEVLLGSK